MQFWQSLPFTHPDEMLELVPVIEEAGFEGIMVADHLFAPESYDSRYPYDSSGEPPFDAQTQFPEVFATISALAMVTTRLRFMPNVYVLPMRHPIEVAKGLSTAAVFSKNRVVFGIGAGWLQEEFEILGRPFDARGRRMDEQIPIVQRLLAGEVVSADGEFYRFEPIRINPIPSGKVPFWIGGMNAAALRRAGQYGDGWTGAGTTFEETIAILTELQRQRKKFGRDREPFDCMIPLTEQLPPDKMKRLFDLGLTATVSWPLSFQMAPGATMQQKKDKLRELGETMIAPVNGPR
ncbi:MAG: TIGR03619 family F420-dependent LLM class oxidoreductase [Myxococcota bacterium]